MFSRTLGLDAASPSRLRGRAHAGLGPKLGICFALFGGCYEGSDLAEKEPTPGHPGGECLPGELCDEGVCEEDLGVCYDPMDPCVGFFCGGHGVCLIHEEFGTPLCECDPGYDNTTYTHFCTPSP